MKAHERFDEIIRVLDRVYGMCYNNDQIICAVLGCYARMSVDAVLSLGMIKKGLKHSSSYSYQRLQLRSSLSNSRHTF